MGRHPNSDPPDLTPKSLRVWVEGIIFLHNKDTINIKKMNYFRVAAKELGFLVMDQPVQTEYSPEPLRKRWTFKRVDPDYAHAVLCEFRDGIAYNDFRDALYKEEPWNNAQITASMKKTYVMVCNLAAAGRLRKTYDENTGATMLHAIGAPRFRRPRIAKWEDLSTDLPPEWADDYKPAWLEEIERGVDREEAREDVRGARR